MKFVFFMLCLFTIGFSQFAKAQPVSHYALLCKKSTNQQDVESIRVEVNSFPSRLMRSFVEVYFHGNYYSSFLASPKENFDQFAETFRLVDRTDRFNFEYKAGLATLVIKNSSISENNFSCSRVPSRSYHIDLEEGDLNTHGTIGTQMIGFLRENISLYRDNIINTETLCYNFTDYVIVQDIYIRERLPNWEPNNPFRGQSVYIKILASQEKNQHFIDFCNNPSQWDDQKLGLNLLLKILDPYTWAI